MSEPKPGEIGRLWISDSPPWPDGHPLSRLAWFGFLHPPTGLGMVLDLQTFDYQLELALTEDQFENDGDGFWDGSEFGWSNYGRCSLGGSWLVARPGGTKMSFRNMSKAPFIVDDPTKPASTFIRELAESSSPRVLHQDPGTTGDVDRDQSFGIYLLGHDHAHSHEILFDQSDDGSDWNLTWSGRVRLTYYWHGETGFHVRARGLPFGGFDVPAEMSDDDAWNFFQLTCEDADGFRLVEGNRGAPAFTRRFVPLSEGTNV